MKSENMTRFCWCWFRNIHLLYNCCKCKPRWKLFLKISHCFLNNFVVSFQ